MVKTKTNYFDSYAIEANLKLGIHYLCRSKKKYANSSTRYNDKLKNLEGVIYISYIVFIHL